MVNDDLILERPVDNFLKILENQEEQSRIDFLRWAFTAWSYNALNLYRLRSLVKAVKKLKEDGFDKLNLKPE